MPDAFALSAVDRLLQAACCLEVATTLTVGLLAIDKAKAGEKADRVLLDVKEAASLLGITPSALSMRVARGQVTGVVKTGRRLQFHRERLVAGLTKKAGR